MDSLNESTELLDCTSAALDAATEIMKGVSRLFYGPYSCIHFLDEDPGLGHIILFP